MDDFAIYFNDLNEEAKARLLKHVGAHEPKEMNWDINMCPLCCYPAPDNSETD